MGGGPKGLTGSSFHVEKLGLLFSFLKPSKTTTSLDSAIPASGCRLLNFDVAVFYSYLYLTGRYIGSNQNR
jgi:hypothetical protein